VSGVRELVFDVRARYGITGAATDQDLERVLDGERIRVRAWDFEAGLIEAIICDRGRWRIGFAKWLPPEWRRWVLVHALIHYFKHRGDHVWMGECFEWLRDRQEREAHEGAGWWFYIGVDPHEARTLAEAAEQLGIPRACLAWWYEAVLRRAS